MAQGADVRTPWTQAPVAGGDEGRRGSGAGAAAGRAAFSSRRARGLSLPHDARRPITLHNAAPTARAATDPGPLRGARRSARPRPGGRKGPVARGRIRRRGARAAAHPAAAPTRLPSRHPLHRVALDKSHAPGGGAGAQLAQAGRGAGDSRGRAARAHHPTRPPLVLGTPRPLTRANAATGALFDR